MGSFDLLGKIFNLNRKADNRLAGRIFKKTSDLREEEIKRLPESFRMGSFDYDGENGIVRYSFIQCPNAEFAKRLRSHGHAEAACHAYSRGDMLHRRLL